MPNQAPDCVTTPESAILYGMYGAGFDAGVYDG
jgi:hypothetical protein